MITESLLSFPGYNISHVFSQLIARGIKQVLCDSTGSELLQTYSWCPLDFAQVPITFAECAVQPTVTYHSHECHQVLSPRHPPSESLNLGVVLGSSDTMAAVH